MSGGDKRVFDPRCSRFLRERSYTVRGLHVALAPTGPVPTVGCADAHQNTPTHNGASEAQRARDRRDPSDLKDLSSPQLSGTLGDSPR
jgi:hypothetical protein